MEKWRKERNYMRIRNKEGDVDTNIITVFGKKIAVSNEIFDAYSSMDRRARYITDDLPRDKEVSLERLYEDGIHFEQNIREQVISPEDIYISRRSNDGLKRKDCADSLMPLGHYRKKINNLYALCFLRVCLQGSVHDVLVFRNEQ